MAYYFTYLDLILFNWFFIIQVLNLRKSTYSIDEIT
jgi:hypothetical protein